ncbi:hypothetical protein [Escherichia phage PJNS034]
MIHPNHFKGAASEMKAAAHFLSKGYEVFFPAITQSAADFVVKSERGYEGVQVKSATPLKSGEANYLQIRLQGKPTPYATHNYLEGDFEHLVVVYGDMMWDFPWELVKDKTSMTFGRLNEDGTISTSGRGGYNPEDYRLR